MLVLYRAIGEEIYINHGEIQFKLIAEKNGKFAVGIKAPEHVLIDRKEVLVKKEPHNRSRQWR